MTTLDTLADAPTSAAFGHRLAPAGDPLEGAAFDALYEAKIEPELAKCEAERQRAVRWFGFALAAAALLLAIELLALRTVVPVLNVATLFITVGLGYLPLQRVSREAKTGVIQALCEPLGVSYRPAGSDPAEFPTYRSLNLLPRPDSKTFQDFFSGRRGSVDFDFCRAVLTEGSGRDRRTVFQGQLFHLATPRRLLSTTVVLRNSGWLSRFECPHGLEKVGLEDPRFNQAFVVFGGDQVEAREILTPTFMEQLNALESAYAGAHLRCAFIGPDLLIAVEGPSRFEIGGMFSSLVQRQRVEGIARGLEQVFGLIDQFAPA